MQPVNPRTLLLPRERPKEEVIILKVQGVFISLVGPVWDTGGPASKSIFPVNPAWDRLSEGGGFEG